ncbi:MAG: hypothetical protein AM325_013755 [Candidatus Thorarchaeota archaeon SMTZ1-45]
MTQRSDIQSSYCDWCGKPRDQWTNRLRYWGLRKHYCSARCYAAGEYQTNLYLALCTIPVLGLATAILSFQLLSNPSEFYVGVVLLSVAIFFAYSSVCICIPMIGRAGRVIE